jgi:c-di-GMP-related signal transduction protein
MDFYIARQPIFTVQKRLFAYELLYRGTKEFPLAGVSGDRATTGLLTSTFLTEGIDVISNSKPCFVNFTEELLIQNTPASFPKKTLVIEILEDVRPTKEVLAACRELSAEGYRIALDDFIYDKSLEPLIKIADIIKIDFRLTPVDTIRKTLQRLTKHKVKLLAEKVETYDEFEKAAKLGFSYFQGYFFNKPEKILIKELALAQITLYNLLAEVTKETTSIDKLYEIISKDVGISYKLLRFINSAYFYRLQEVKTVKHAMAYLGEEELRRFVILMILSDLASVKPNELVRLSLVRAKFCELLALQSQFKSSSSELFLMGLFSLIDSILDTEMSAIMDKLPIADEIKDALSSGTGDFMPFLRAIIAYERAEIPSCTDAVNQINVDMKLLPEIYFESLKYANALT